MCFSNEIVEEYALFHSNCRHSLHVEVWYKRSKFLVKDKRRWKFITLGVRIMEYTLFGVGNDKFKWCRNGSFIGVGG
jgi:hypothetical protein